jgi:hypothetical protein
MYMHVVDGCGVLLRSVVLGRPVESGPPQVGSDQLPVAWLKKRPERRPPALQYITLHDRRIRIMGNLDFEGVLVYRIYIHSSCSISADHQVKVTSLVIVITMPSPSKEIVPTAGFPPTSSSSSW